MRPAQGPAGGPEQPADEPVGCHGDSGRDRARAHYLHVVVASALLARNLVLLGGCLGGDAVGVAWCGAFKRWLAVLA